MKRWEKSGRRRREDSSGGKGFARAEDKFVL